VLSAENVSEDGRGLARPPTDTPDRHANSMQHFANTLPDSADTENHRPCAGDEFRLSISPAMGSLLVQHLGQANAECQHRAQDIFGHRLIEDTAGIGQHDMASDEVAKK